MSASKRNDTSELSLKAQVALIRIELDTVKDDMVDVKKEVGNLKNYQLDSVVFSEKLDGRLDNGLDHLKKVEEKLRHIEDRLESLFDATNQKIDDYRKNENKRRGSILIGIVSTLATLVIGLVAYIFDKLIK